MTDEVPLLSTASDESKLLSSVRSQISSLIRQVQRSDSQRQAEVAQLSHQNQYLWDAYCHISMQLEQLRVPDSRTYASYQHNPYYQAIPTALANGSATASGRHYGEGFVNQDLGSATPAIGADPGEPAQDHAQNSRGVGGRPAHFVTDSARVLSNDRDNAQAARLSGPQTDASASDVERTPSVGSDDSVSSSRSSSTGRDSERDGDSTSARSRNSSGMESSLSLGRSEQAHSTKLHHRRKQRHRRLAQQGKNVKVDTVHGPTVHRTAGQTRHAHQESAQASVEEPKVHESLTVASHAHSAPSQPAAHVVLDSSRSGERYGKSGGERANLSGGAGAHAQAQATARPAGHDNSVHPRQTGGSANAGHTTRHPRAVTGGHYRASHFVKPQDFPQVPVHCSQDTPKGHLRDLISAMLSLENLTEYEAFVVQRLQDTAQYVQSESAYANVPTTTAAENAGVPAEVVAAMIKSHIIQKASRKSIKNFAKLRFVHEQEKNRLRIITWTEFLNMYFEKPFSPSLISDTIELAVAVGNNPHHTSVKLDMPKAYYQIPLEHKISLRHGVLINNETYAFTRAGMGSFYPAELTQSILEAITILARRALDDQKTYSKIHVDNLILHGETVLANKLADEIIATATKFNFCIGIDSSEATLGMVFENGKTAVAEKTLSKIRNAMTRVLEDPDIEMQDVHEYISRLLYASRVLRLPLAEFYVPMKFLRRRLSAIASNAAKPSDKAMLWRCAVPALRTWSERVLENKPVSHKYDPNSKPNIVLFVDASTTGWGAVMFNEDDGNVREVGGAWPTRIESKDVPVHENKAVGLAIKQLKSSLEHYRYGGIVRIITDSTSSQGALAKGYSHSFDMNQALKSSLAALRGEWQVDAQWVPTEHNLADAKSRGSSVLGELASRLGPRGAVRASLERAGNIVPVTRA